MANKNELKKYHFIYKTTNLLNGEYYIGMHSTSNLHDKYLGSGTRLRRSIRKYGKENFQIEILEFLNNRESLAKREKELVNIDLLSESSCINLKIGGNGGNLGKNGLHLGGDGFKSANLYWELPKNKERKKKKASEIFRKLWKDKVFFYKDNWTGKKHNPETIKKIKESSKGKGVGSTNSQYGTCWITDGIKNIKIKKDTPIPEGWNKGRKIIK
jgi:hypothetical protein